MLSLFGNFFGNSNSKIIKKYLPLVKEINSYADKFASLTDDALKTKTTEFKQRLANKETLDELLPEAFAVIREAATRVLGQRHYDVQLMGGITLHNAMIAEMFTGEGKTLVATLPAYLNALTGKGVHLITVNDYLARRDSEWMGTIYKFLGLSVGCITGSSSEEERKAAYLADITYGTNNEFGFDYLRDNMKLTTSQICQRPFNYAIIDEIDSILIDEARTPLIISGPAEDKTTVYKIVNGFVKLFTPKEDFEVDEKHKSINITEQGLAKLEKILANAGMVAKSSLFEAQNIQLYHFVTQAIRAHYLFKKEVDYLIQDGQVVLIDEFTGRIMDGRRFSDGLHQALEAKEGIKIRQENQTLASITFQNYFKMYPKLSGMTGTASTESLEFADIYSLKVVSIPAHQPVTRKDLNDEIYLTYKEKVEAIVAKVKECYAKGQPVLIGTVSIEKSEKLSLALKAAKLPHNILNAKHHDKEAQIISQAGKSGSITIATNMAGRGTDIQLGGNADMIISHTSMEGLTEKEQQEQTLQIKQEVQADKEKVLQAGGLCVIGTERHESRRIDNQLRGRSGRQGEIGVSIFYISLEDDLMRIFGSSKLEGLLKRLGFKEGESVSHPLISKAIEKAQKKVEEYNYEIRKNVVKFDNVINEQRQVIYSQRKEIINHKINIMYLIEDNREDMIDKIFTIHLPEDKYRDQWSFPALKADLARLFNIHKLDVEDLFINQSTSKDDVKNVIIELSVKRINQQIEIVQQENFENTLREICLQILDHAWKRHLLELDYVRSSINLRAYANKDPFNEYQKESFYLFSSMLEDFKEQLVSVVHHIEFRIAENEVESTESSNINKVEKIGRNSPCPCGSGKKYKACHGK